MVGFIGDNIARVQNFYIEAENRLASAAKNLLPAHLHDLVDKVVRAVPEIFCCLSLLTGTLKPAAMVYGGVKIIWAISPMVHALFTGQDMQKARNEAQDRLQQSFEKFKPAVFVSFAVMSAVSAILGLASLSPTLLLISVFLGIMSKIGYDACQPPTAQPQGLQT